MSRFSELVFVSTPVFASFDLWSPIELFDAFKLLTLTSLLFSLFLLMTAALVVAATVAPDGTAFADPPLDSFRLYRNLIIFHGQLERYAEWLNRINFCIWHTAEGLVIVCEPGVVQHLLHLTQLTCVQIKIDSWTYVGNQYMGFNSGGRSLTWCWLHLIRLKWGVHVYHYIATRGATIDSYSVLAIIIWKVCVSFDSQVPSILTI